MKIEEIGAGGQAEGTRRAEIQRMAQSMAAERLAGMQASSENQPVAQSKAAVQEDAVKLSNQAVDKVTQSNPTVMNKRDQLRESLLDKLNSEVLNPDSDFNRKKSKESGDSGDKKKRKVERKKEWEPEAQPGQIHEGREVIGKIRVTTEVKEEGGDGGAVGAVGRASGGAKNSKAAGAPDRAKSSAQASKDSKSNQGPQASKDPKDEAKETKEVAAAQNMEKSGLKVEGMDQSGKSKTEEQSASQAGGVKEFDVRGRSFGTTQTLSVKPAKELQPGEKSLGTFRKLDDKPMLKYVTLHSKDTKDAVKELKKNAQAAGESPEAIQQAVQKLRDKTQP